MLLAEEIASPTHDLFQHITSEIEKVFIGQSELVLGTLVALFSNGHVLIESVPGLGKTLFVARSAACWAAASAASNSRPT